MQKTIITVGILLFSGCSAEQVPIPESAIEKIYSINQVETVNKYIEVIGAEDKPGYFVVTLEIKHVPGITDALEDFYSQAELYTKVVAQVTVEILDEHEINRNVSVWGRLIFSKDEIVGSSLFHVGNSNRSLPATR